MYTILRLNSGIYTSSDDLSVPINKIFTTKNNTNALFFKTCGVFKNFYRIQYRKNLWPLLLWFYKHRVGGLKDNRKQRILLSLVLQDIISLYIVWRRVRGYPIRGQRTWSNGKTANTFANPLVPFRVAQFLSAFGGKKRINFSTLAKAEYMNKFWLRFYTSEWLQARRSLKKFLHRKTNHLQIDLVSLSKGITGGYKRYGNASKLNKSKKQLKSATLGLPLFFSRFMYGAPKTRKFPFKITVEQQQKSIFKSQKKKKIKKKIKKTSKQK